MSSKKYLENLRSALIKTTVDEENFTLNESEFRALRIVEKSLPHDADFKNTQPHSILKPCLYSSLAASVLVSVLFTLFITLSFNKKIVDIEGQNRAYVDRKPLKQAELKIDENNKLVVKLMGELSEAKQEFLVLAEKINTINSNIGSSRKELEQLAHDVRELDLVRERVASMKNHSLDISELNSFHGTTALMVEELKESQAKFDTNLSTIRAKLVNYDKSIDKLKELQKKSIKLNDKNLSLVKKSHSNMYLRLESLSALCHEIKTNKYSDSQNFVVKLEKSKDEKEQPVGIIEPAVQAIDIATGNILEGIHNVFKATIINI